jgi:hypothetical protein
MAMNDGPAYELPAESWSTETERADRAAARDREIRRWEERTAAREAAFQADQSVALATTSPRGARGLFIS